MPWITQEELDKINVRITALEQDTESLQNKVGRTFYLGNDSCFLAFHGKDPRKTVTFHEVISMILYHLKLELTEHSKEYYVALEKKK